jgi:DNA-binding transcriptional LysR family regulator
MIVYPLDADTMLRKYKGYVIAHERFQLVLNNKHPLAAKKTVDIRELKDELFVFIQHSKRKIEQPYHLCTAEGFKPRVKYTTNSLESHRQIIAGGLAIGFVSEGNLPFYSADANLSILDINDHQFFQTVMIGFKREKHLSETARIFRDFVMDHFQIAPPDQK